MKYTTAKKRITVARYAIASQEIEGVVLTAGHSRMIKKLALGQLTYDELKSQVCKTAKRAG